MKTQRPKSIFLTGFIETQVEKGIPRTYGYPPSSLPEVKIESMKMRSSFLVALDTEGKHNDDPSAQS